MHNFITSLLFRESDERTKTTPKHYKASSRSVKRIPRIMEFMLPVETEDLSDINREENFTSQYDCDKDTSF